MCELRGEVSALKVRVCLSVCLSVRPSVCLSVSLSVFDVSRYTENPATERSARTSEELRGNLLHITADHKVLSEGCESRDNHRYAVVVQDLATQWIQSYPC